MNGFVILNKEQGMTSFKASSLLRKIYGEKKTGHTGTLDPMATGVLPVALGKATRFIDFLPQSDKAYIARFRLGITTDTLDITGKVLSEQKADVAFEEVKNAAKSFVGEITQVPPMYSALSVNGVRLYDMARKGIEIEREGRRVTVYSLELTQCENNEYEIAVNCSKGTYIRTLTDDIGRLLGCGAVMTSLCRTLSNGFSISSALTAAELQSNPEKGVYSTDYPFFVFPEVYVSSAQSKRFSNGGELSADRLGIETCASVYRVYSPDGLFLGLGEIEQTDMSLLKVKRVFAQ